MAIANSTQNPNHFSNAIDTPLSDTFAEEMLGKLESQAATLSCEEMDKIEKFWEEDRAGRRCALINLTKPFSFIKEGVLKDISFAEALAGVYNSLDPEKYEAIASLLRNAQIRIMFALAGRDDMEELLAMCEKSGGKDHD